MAPYSNKLVVWEPMRLSEERINERVAILMITIGSTQHGEIGNLNENADELMQIAKYQTGTSQANK